MLYSSEVPPVTKEFAEHLKLVFKPREIRTDTTMAEIQRDAGHIEVVNYVLAHQVGRTMLGSFDTPPAPEKKPNVLYRIYNKIVSIVKKVFNVSK